MRVDKVKMAFQNESRGDLEKLSVAHPRISAQVVNIQVPQVIQQDTSFGNIRCNQ
jgi:hypothetical protein